MMPYVFTKSLNNMLEKYNEEKWEIKYSITIVKASSGSKYSICVSSLLALVMFKKILGYRATQ